MSSCQLQKKTTDLSTQAPDGWLELDRVPSDSDAEAASAAAGESNYE